MKNVPKFLVGPFRSVLRLVLQEIQAKDLGRCERVGISSCRHLGCCCSDVKRVDRIVGMESGTLRKPR